MDTRSRAKAHQVFQNIDCVMFYTPDLDAGIAYYRDGLGLALLWRTDSAAGLGMQGQATEIVLQSEKKFREIDIKVESVEEALIALRAAGGNVVAGPFDIDIGKAAVVRDPWGNEYVLLDMSKGRYSTDGEGRVIGLMPE